MGLALETDNFRREQTLASDLASDCNGSNRDSGSRPQAVHVFQAECALAFGLPEIGDSRESFPTALAP